MQLNDLKAKIKSSAMIILLKKIIFIGAKTKCKKNECWCVSGGGDSCYGMCDPDECHDKVDCPGNGYWCDSEGT